MKNLYEKQLEKYREYCDEIKDRCELILENDIELIFDIDSITINNICVLQYNKSTLIPKTLFIDIIDTPEKYSLVKNIMNNIDELRDIISRYVLFYNHTYVNFTDKGLSSNPEYVRKVEELKAIQRNNPHSFDDLNIPIIIDDTLYKLHITKYGTEKKVEVKINYYTEIDNVNTLLGGYKIDKENFANDLAYQIVYKKLTHL